jgi:hypothetical protein
VKDQNGRIEIKGRYGNHVSWWRFTLLHAAQVFGITCCKPRPGRTA